MRVLLVFCLVLTGCGAGTSTDWGSRFRLLPQPTLEVLRSMDHMPSYEAVLPTDELPAPHRALLAEHLDSIFLVEDFKGAGMTDIHDGRIFWYFNPIITSMSLGELLQWRETAPLNFNAEVTLSVTASEAPGALHTLIHEASHVYDHFRRVTPYLEPALRASDSPRETPFVRGVWKDFREPVRGVLEPGYSGYGLNGEIPAGQAETMFGRLADSPFVSLYAAQSWAEDYAEAYTWWYLQKRWGLTYSVSVTTAQGTVVFQPLENPRVKERQSSFSLDS